MLKPTLLNIYFGKYIQCNGRQLLLYQVAEWKLRSSQEPQIKRQSNVFSICLSPTRCPVKGLGRLTLQIYNVFETKNNFGEKYVFLFVTLHKPLQPCGSYQNKALSAELKQFFRFISSQNGG